uniref:Endonuclease/exonuclease/phosphatase domain-containing protein n=1 Tax=Solanum lycopersicum TaxID=4081 RepID=A0A3Q7FR14_SOLLC
MRPALGALGDSHNDEAFFLKEKQPMYSRPTDSGSKHEPDGRVILAEFETFRILNTYVPNNGWKEEESSFPRRRKWDKRMLEFVLATSDKPLIWCGDLNVSHEDIDVSHPEFFSAAKLNGYTPPNKENKCFWGLEGHSNLIGSERAERTALTCQEFAYSRVSCHSEQG